MDNIKGLHHLGLPVNDSAKTTAFYNKLGFKTIYETMNGSVKVVFLEKDGLIIETYETGSAAMQDGAWDHICLSVDDVNKTWKEVVDGLGIPAIDNKMETLPFFKNGVKFFKVYGPNHEIIEFLEML